MSELELTDWHGDWMLVAPDHLPDWLPSHGLDIVKFEFDTWGGGSVELAHEQVRELIAHLESLLTTNPSRHGTA